MAKLKNNFIDSIGTKYKNISAHINRTGLGSFLKTKIYDHYIGFRFKMAGIHYYIPAAHETVSSVTQFNDKFKTLPSSFYSVKEALTLILLPHHAISLYDFGCGSGWVLNYGMLLGFRQVAGIEIDKAVMENATYNCNMLKRKGYPTPYTIELGDAATATIPEGTNVIYLYNPFGLETMEKVSANIISYALKSAADVYIIYCLPTYQQFFEKEESCEKIYERFYKYKTLVELSVFKIAGS